MKRRAWGILGTDLLFFVASFAAAISSMDANASIEKTPDPAKVLTQVIAQKEESDTLLFPARASSLVQTKIYAETEGVIRSLPVNVGSQVTRKKEIMTIRHTDPVYQYAPVRVTSPVSGIVSSLEVTEGTQVTKGQLLATVTDPSKLRLTIEVPAQDLPSVRAGLIGEFRAADLKAPLSIRVLGVSPLVDAKTGTANAELQLIDSPEKSGLLPGTLGQVALKTNIHSAISIPEDALVYRDGKTLVRTLVDGKVKQTEVELGPSRRGQVEVLKGLTANDRLITRSSRFVSEGEAVTTEESSAPKT